MFDSDIFVHEHFATVYIAHVIFPPPLVGPSSDLFSGVLYHGYNPPPGFCWDTLCSDDPIMVSVFKL